MHTLRVTLYVVRSRYCPCRVAVKTKDGSVYNPLRCIDSLTATLTRPDGTRINLMIHPLYDDDCTLLVHLLIKWPLISGQHKVQNGQYIQLLVACGFGAVACLTCCSCVLCGWLHSPDIKPLLLRPSDCTYILAVLAISLFVPVTVFLVLCRSL